MLRRLRGVLVVGVGLAAFSAASRDPIDRIREADIKADLCALAGDSMRGREAGRSTS